MLTKPLGKKEEPMRQDKPATPKYPALKSAFTAAHRKAAAEEQQNRADTQSRADALAAEADDERRLELELEQLLNQMGTLTSCAPEVQAQNDEQVRLMTLSLIDAAAKQEKFRREAQEAASRKKPLAETRIKTRKPRYRMKKQGRGLTQMTTMEEFLKASQPLVTACVAATFAQRAFSADCRSAAQLQAPRPLPA